MATVLALNPTQVHARSGDQWEATPGEALAGLEEYQVSQRDLFASAPEPFSPEAPNQYHLGDRAKPETLIEQEQVSRLAYLTSKGRDDITKALRSGAISPPRGGATYGDAGYFDPRRQDGAHVNVFTGEAQILGDGSGAVHALDGAMADNWMTAPVTLYRALVVPDDADFTPGARWYEPAYTSATFTPDTAVRFVAQTEDTGRPLFMLIEVPPGTQFIPGAEPVDEIVLERGATFEVLEDRGDTITVRFQRFDNTEPPAIEEDA